MTLKWTGKRCCHRVPFAIYCDFESFLQPNPDYDPSSNDNTKICDEHVPSGFGLYTVSEHEEHQTDIIVYSGENVMETFFETLMSERERITSILAVQNAMKKLTKAEWRRFHSTKK